MVAVVVVAGSCPQTPYPGLAQVAVSSKKVAVVAAMVVGSGSSCGCGCLSALDAGNAQLPIPPEKSCEHMALVLLSKRWCGDTVDTTSLWYCDLAMVAGCCSTLPADLAAQDVYVCVCFLCC
jgi:hypothetical protein